MALFGRHKKDSPPPEPEPTPHDPELIQAAAGVGLQWADDVGPRIHQAYDNIHRASRVLHGFPPKYSSTVDVGIPNMFYTDVFTGTIDGRAVTVANVRTPIEAMSLEYAAKVHTTSLVTVELSTLVPYQVEPRMRHQAFHGLEMKTGDEAFDSAYRIVGLVALGESPFASAEVRQRIAAHDDWIFVFDGPMLACVGKEGFDDGEELVTRVHEAIGVVTAFPATVAPAQVDHSVDDLLVRIDKLESVEDAIAFLQTLSPSDRDRLAHSPTPLAKFADVQTPDEIMQRFMALDLNERMQVLAMFEKTK